MISDKINHRPLFNEILNASYMYNEQIKYYTLHSEYNEGVDCLEVLYGKCPLALNREHVDI